MQGPIITPVPVRADAHRMIVAGIEVFQIDPTTKLATKLDLKSVFPGEGDAEDKKEETTPSTPSPNVKSEPIKPVNLQGVTAPIKETDGVKVDSTPVDVKDAVAEEIKPETTQKEDVKAEETAGTGEKTPATDTTSDKKEETTPEVETTGEKSDNNQNNSNGKNKNKNKNK
jgi:hypothetical protein